MRPGWSEFPLFTSCLEEVFSETGLPVLPCSRKPAAPRSYVPRRVSQTLLSYKTPWLRAHLPQRSCSAKKVRLSSGTGCRSRPCNLPPHAAQGLSLAVGTIALTAISPICSRSLPRSSGSGCAGCARLLSLTGVQPSCVSGSGVLLHRRGLFLNLRWSSPEECTGKRNVLNP